MMPFMWIKRKRQFFGDQSLAVELQNFNIRSRFHTGIDDICAAAKGYEYMAELQLNAANAV